MFENKDDHKILETLSLELKAVEDDGTVIGMGSTFGNVDTYGDRISPKAFNRTLKSGRQVVMLFNHNSDHVIGKWTDIKKTKDGLSVKGSLNLDTPLGKTVHANLKHGDFSGLSIGFFTMKDSFNDDGTRTIDELKLMEVSVTPFPANEEATISSVKNRALEGFELLPKEKQHEVLGFIKSLEISLPTDNSAHSEDDQPIIEEDKSDSIEGKDADKLCHSSEELDKPTVDSDLIDSIKTLIAKLSGMEKDSQMQELLHSIKSLNSEITFEEKKENE